jgi:CelD/BcsL family acetyltransferase involved in cellulose biosynthesis
MEASFALHRAPWRDKNKTGMLDGPGLEYFHLAAARGLWKRGLVRLHALRLHERIVAVHFSPGALIMAYSIEQAILEGVREFDFLRGRDAYKSGLGAPSRR